MLFLFAESKETQGFSGWLDLRRLMDSLTKNACLFKVSWPNHNRSIFPHFFFFFFWLILSCMPSCCSSQGFIMLLQPIPVILALRSHTSNCSPDSCLCLFIIATWNRGRLYFPSEHYFYWFVSLFMMLFQLQAGSKIVAKCYSQAFMYLTYKHFYCSNVILWAGVRRGDKKDAHFLISFQ